jgi:hypothetical protein
VLFQTIKGTCMALKNLAEAPPPNAKKRGKLKRLPRF